MLAISCVCTAWLYAWLCDKAAFAWRLAFVSRPKISISQLADTGTLYVHDAIKPVVEKLYANVKCGNEAQISIDSNSKPDYREKLEAELKALRESEMWQTAVTVRKLRPENN